MTLQKLWLDHDHLLTLEGIAIEEGLILSTSGDAELDGTPEAARTRVNGNPVARDRLLQLIIAYETVDSNFTPFDWSKLVSEKLISDDAELLKGMFQNPRWDPIYDSTHPDFNLLRPEEQRRAEYARKTARELIHLSRDVLIETAIRRDDPPAFAHQREARRSYLNGVYDECVEAALAELNPQVSFFSLLDPLPNANKDRSHLADAISETYNALIKGVFISCTEQCSLAGPGVTVPLPALKGAERVGEVYSLVETRLADLTLPLPRSIREAIDLRSNVHVASFRHALKGWIETIKVGDEAAEKKIRRDLYMANAAMKAVAPLRPLSQGPLKFLLPATGYITLPPSVAFYWTTAQFASVVAEGLVDAYAGWTMLCRK